MTIQGESVSGALPFRVGSFEGWGHWVSPQGEGDYVVRYAITDAGNGTAHHAVRREFTGADGASLYVEETTVLFAPQPRNGLAVVIAGPKGSVTGLGYVFGNQCHYDADIAPGTRLEFTFTVVDARRIDGLASSTNAGDVTCWREQLVWVGTVPDGAASDGAASDGAASDGAAARDYTEPPQEGSW